MSAPAPDTPRFAVYDVDEALALDDPDEAADLLAGMLHGPAEEWRDHEVDFYETHTAIVRIWANGLYSWWTNISSGRTIVNVERVFRAMGAVQSADLLLRALTLFPNGNPPATYPEIEQAVHSVYQANERIVEEISRALEMTDEARSRLLIEWVKANRTLWLRSKDRENG